MMQYHILPDPQGAKELKKLQGGPSQGQTEQAVQVGRFKVSSN